MIAHTATYFNTLEDTLPTHRNGALVEYVYHVGNFVYMIDVEKDDDRYYINHHVYDLSVGDFVYLPKVSGHSPSTTVPMELFTEVV
jgi:hypothetical protein